MRYKPGTYKYPTVVVGKNGQIEDIKEGSAPTSVDNDPILPDGEYANCTITVKGGQIANVQQGAALPSGGALLSGLARLDQGACNVAIPNMPDSAKVFLSRGRANLPPHTFGLLYPDSFTSNGFDIQSIRIDGSGQRNFEDSGQVYWRVEW